IIVTCKAFGEKPIDIKWIKDRIEIDLIVERKYKVKKKETNDGLMSELIATSSTRFESGSYLCITWNAYGQSELTTRVIVEEAPDAPNDVKVFERGSKFVTFKIVAPYYGNNELLKYIMQWKKQK
ncbi:cell adhesion molecule-like protein, partial [Leptotrombidium deliense]